MSATEHIVEAYFRYRLNCFTMHDVKVVGGNNRQFDLLAYQVQSGEQYHVEIGVTHNLGFAPRLDHLSRQFDRKFFGAPSDRAGPNTDSAKGRVYEKQIEQTYVRVGFEPSRVRRIWVMWTSHAKDKDGVDVFLEKYCRQKGLALPIEVWSFRDRILRELIEEIGTANYDDALLRTISLVRQFDLQTTRRTVAS